MTEKSCAYSELRCQVGMKHTVMHGGLSFGDKEDPRVCLLLRDYASSYSGSAHKFLFPQSPSIWVSDNNIS